MLHQRRPQDPATLPKYVCDLHGANQSHDTADCRGRTFGARAGDGDGAQAAVTGATADALPPRRGKCSKPGMASMKMAEYMGLLPGTCAPPSVGGAGGGGGANDPPPPPLRVIVLGCGTSRLSEMIHNQQGARVAITSTDISGVAVEHMRARCPHMVWQQADACNLKRDFPPASFDICIDKGVSDSVRGPCPPVAPVAGCALHGLPHPIPPTRALLGSHTCCASARAAVHALC